MASAQGLTSFNFFVNGYETRTQGLDAVAAYKLDLHAAGRLALTGALNLNRTRVQSSDAGVINARQRQYLERRLPRHVETLSAEYSLARFGVVLRGRHYGQWTEPLNETTDDSGRLIYNQTFGNELFIDVLLSYDFTRALRLTVGVENIFDNYPDKARFPNTPEDAVAGKPPTTGRIYPSQRPYESDGGRVYARLNATF